MIDWLKIENRVRATPLDLLKQGIQQSQWECVELAYMMLTGENLKVVPVANSTPTFVPTTIINESTPVTINNDKIAKAYIDKATADTGVHYIENKSAGGERIYARKQSILMQNRPNKFEDTLIESPDDIKLSEQLKEKRVSQAQRRPPIPMIPVRCSVCGTHEKVDPILAPKNLTAKYKMRYVCNSCSVGAKNDRDDDTSFDEVIDDESEE